MHDAPLHQGQSSIDVQAVQRQVRHVGHDESAGCMSTSTHIRHSCRINCGNTQHFGDYVHPSVGARVVARPHMHGEAHGEPRTSKTHRTPQRAHRVDVGAVAAVITELSIYNNS